MKHLLVTSITGLALSLLALARWLDGGSSSGPGRNRHPSGYSQGSPAKRIDLPRSRYRFSHVPPSRWQVVKAGLAILFNSVCFAVSPVGAGAGA